MCLDAKGASDAEFAARPDKPRPHLAPRRLPVARRHLCRGASSRRAGASGADDHEPTVAAVTNPAGQATTSIVINGTTVTGAVTNAGTISPGTLVGTGTAALSVTNSTIGGGITNTGTITANGANSNFGTSIIVTGSTVSGGITNAGTINASGGATAGHAIGILVQNNSTVSGGIANSGTINVVSGEAAIWHFRSEQHRLRRYRQ